MGRGLALALLAGCLGCRSTPPEAPFVGLPVTVTTRYYAGTSLSGPVQRDDGDRDFANAIAVTVSLYAIDTPPGERLEPLGPHARLIASTLGDQPFLPAPRLLAGARCASIPDAAAERERIQRGELGRSILLAEPCAVLPAGVTALVWLRGFGSSATSLRRRLTFELHRPADGSSSVELAITGSETDPDTSGAPRAPESVTKSELVSLDLALAGDDAGVVFLLPPPEDGFDTRAIAAVVSLAKEPADDAARLARQRETLHCQLELEQTSASMREPEPVPESGVTWPAAEAAVAGLVAPAHQRSSLVFLASATNARLTRDLAIAGDDATVNELVAAARKDPHLMGGRLQGAELAWALESFSFALLLQRLAAAPLPPELEAALVRRAGQVARESDALAGVLKVSHSLEELDQQLVRANLIMLEAMAPSARVRAYDWLVARSQAPEGFDPLAPSRQRRAALAKLPGSEPAPEPQGPEP